MHMFIVIFYLFHQILVLHTQIPIFLFDRKQKLFLQLVFLYNIKTVFIKCQYIDIIFLLHITRGPRKGTYPLFPTISFCQYIIESYYVSSSFILAIMQSLKTVDMTTNI